MKNKIIGLIFLTTILVSCNNVIRVDEKNKETNRSVRESDLTESVNYNGIKTCEEGENLALKELEEGKIKYIFSSYGSRQELPKKLNQLYGIEIINVEGVLGIPNKCYNDKMYEVIQSKFGKNAFNKAME